MDEEYKLIYYDVKGIGEIIRLIFAAAGVPFEDVRLPFEFEKLPAKKPKNLIPADWKDRVPYGKLPMLIIGNGERKLVSSKPICRYLATKFGLSADDPFDDAKCDEYMDALRDFFDLWRPIYTCMDNQDQKASVLNRLKQTAIPRYMGKFDAIIANNNGRNLVGNKLTWADIYLAHALTNFSELFEIDMMENYPAITNLVNHVFSISAIKDWVDTRPKTLW